MIVQGVATWTLALDLSSTDARALFVRIASAIADDIARGRLAPGTRLPGTRKLAQSLGVHRNTVVAAYAELESQGWIESAASRGTFVSERLPRDPTRAVARSLRERNAPRAKVPARTAYALGPNRWGAPAVTPPRGLIAMGGGMPDPRLAPRVLLARAYRRAMQRVGADALDYADSYGNRRLRSALAEMLSATRGITCTADDILVTRGSQMALWLIAQVLLEPEHAVGVEAFGYRPAWEALSLTGASLDPFDLDERGLDVAALEASLHERPLRAVYVTPHHQYPTTATLAPERRARLLALARQHGFAILEDDYDNEFHYEGRPVLPMAATDTSGSVVYIGTLSKVLAPGIRVGWVVAPAPMLERLAALRSRIDRQGDHVLQAAVAELMEDGDVQRHVWRMKRAYEKRRDIVVEALRAQLGGVLEFDQPNGGMALWARAHGVDVARWQRACAAAGVEISIGRQFAFDRRDHPFVRIGFARASPEELVEGVTRMRKALPGRARKAAASAQRQPSRPRRSRTG